MSSANFDDTSIRLLAETSWEVCNKIGGIYTVLSTKAKVLQKKFGDRLVFVGPMTESSVDTNLYFEEDKEIFNSFESKGKFPFSIKIKTGRWVIPGSPQVILVDFQHVFPQLDSIFGLMWEKFGVESLHEYGDYREGCAFSVAAAIVIHELGRYLGLEDNNVFAHFNEWTTGMGLLYLQILAPDSATLFTTHATSIGRSICGNGKPLYDYFNGYHGDQMARELNMEAKHSLEKQAAHNADCFTAVSELTAMECSQLLEKAPDVVTPNGFEPDFVPAEKKYFYLRSKGREKILNIASWLKGKNFSDSTFILATSGRNEYRNKGLDIFIDTLSVVDSYELDKEIIGLILVPAWVREPDMRLSEYLNGNDAIHPNVSLQTHSLNNEESDSIICRLRELKGSGKIDRKVNLIYVPCYLDGGDGIFNISYYDLLPALDMSLFPSYYEPWGYTPLESIAFGVPTLTSDKSGFGQWVLTNFTNSIESTGVKVVGRTDSNYHEFTHEAAEEVVRLSSKSIKEREEIREKAARTSNKADWDIFIQHYYDAFRIAATNRNIRNKQ